VRQYRHKITPKDLYQFYTYKKNYPVENNVVPIPYVKKEEVTNHKNSLDYRQWIAIVEDYFEQIKNVLIEGNKFNLPEKLGTLVIQVHQPKRLVDRVKCRNFGETKHNNPKVLNDGGFLFKIKWDRKFCSIYDAIYWKADLINSYKKQFYERHDKDYTYVFKFNRPR
jgi:nucleoid DNA-binding protein